MRRGREIFWKMDAPPMRLASETPSSMCARQLRGSSARAFSRTSSAAAVSPSFSSRAAASQVSTPASSGCADASCASSACATNATLEVSFFRPFWGDYWIIDLADDYSYAVVGHPGRDYLWILARTPAMAEATFQGIVARLQAKGYQTSRLVR